MNLHQRLHLIVPMHLHQLLRIIKMMMTKKSMIERIRINRQVHQLAIALQLALAPQQVTRLITVLPLQPQHLPPPPRIIQQLIAPHILQVHQRPIVPQPRLVQVLLPLSLHMSQQ